MINLYDPSLSGLSSYGSDGDAIGTFDDTNSATDGLGVASVTYTFYATDAFWATTGSNIAFGATSDTGANSGSFFTLTYRSALHGVHGEYQGCRRRAGTGLWRMLGAEAGLVLYLVRKRRNHAA